MRISALHLIVFAVRVVALVIGLVAGLIVVEFAVEMAAEFDAGLVVGYSEFLLLFILSFSFLRTSPFFGMKISCMTV